jgi:hypothetical protein
MRASSSRYKGVSPAVAARVVDLAEREVLRESARGDDRLLLHLGRVVALERAPLQLVAKAEGVDDLGRRRQQRHDAHGSSLAHVVLHHGRPARPDRRDEAGYHALVPG